MKITLPDGTTMEGTPEELVRVGMLQQVATAEGIDYPEPVEDAVEPYTVEKFLLDLGIFPEHEERTKTRDSVVYSCMQFVDELAEIGPDLHRRVSEVDPSYDGDWEGKFFKFKFIVNKEKRVVTAIVRNTNMTGELSSTNLKSIGVARCAPDDVFNEFIGKAIALSRALGLNIPDFVIQAPKPEDFAKGDIIRVHGEEHEVYAVRPTHRTTGVDNGFEFTGQEEGLTVIKNYSFGAYEYWAPIDHCVVVDDTKRYVNEYTF